MYPPIGVKITESGNSIPIPLKAMPAIGHNPIMACVKNDKFIDFLDVRIATTKEEIIIGEKNITKLNK